jgi:hypothetical protein
MAINFVPNDPLAPAPPMRRQPPRPNRPANRAGFTFLNPVAEDVYDPTAKPVEFLFWQCREAALLAAETWETLEGNLTSWSPKARDPKKLEVDQDHNDPNFQGGQKLNAFYDRVGLRFFVLDTGTKTYFTGISTDTVTHEAGHALLDALRPEFFESFRPEVNAFHESFGDMWALLSALMDKPTRQALLGASADLKSANFVESLSEYLSNAALEVFGNVSPSKPRRALNTFQYQLPTTLPPGSFQDSPDLLSAEPHSFSRVFTGCFYDTLANIFAGTTKNEAGLLTAATTVGKLLIEAARTARHTSRFYLEVGQRMIQADASLFGGANAAAIQQAFANHNLNLVGMGLIASPTTSLLGHAPRVTKAAASLAPATIKDLRGRIRATKGSKMMVGAINVAGEKLAEITHLRAVPLGKVDKSLKGVVAMASEVVRVGGSGKMAAVMGALPQPDRTVDEVEHFVLTLVKMGRIAHIGPRPKAKKGMVASRAKLREPRMATHEIRTVGGKKVLQRIRFICGPCGCPEARAIRSR